LTIRYTPRRRGKDLPTLPPASVTANSSTPAPICAENSPSTPSTSTSAHPPHPNAHPPLSVRGRPPRSSRRLRHEPPNADAPLRVRPRPSPRPPYHSAPGPDCRYLASDPAKNRLVLPGTLRSTWNTAPAWPLGDARPRLRPGPQTQPYGQLHRRPESRIRPASHRPCRHLETTRHPGPRAPSASPGLPAHHVTVTQKPARQNHSTARRPPGPRASPLAPHPGHSRPGLEDPAGQSRPITEIRPASGPPQPPPNRRHPPKPPVPWAKRPRDRPYNLTNGPSQRHRTSPPRSRRQLPARRRAGSRCSQIAETARGSPGTVPRSGTTPPELSAAAV